MQQQCCYFFRKKLQNALRIYCEGKKNDVHHSEQMTFHYASYPTPLEKPFPSCKKNLINA